MAAPVEKGLYAPDELGMSEVTTRTATTPALDETAWKVAKDRTFDQVNSQYARMPDTS